MKRIMILACTILLLLPMTAMAEREYVSTELIEKASALDGQEVIYSGEVIGDIMKRGDHVWLNVSDGVNAVGVWVESDRLSGVATPGRYGEHGDEVRVTGIFYRACAEHGGDMDIHASTIDRLGIGYPVIHNVQPWSLVLALFFTVVDMVIAILFLRKKSGHLSCFRVSPSHFASQR